jgi:serine/threonine protein kinase
MIIPAIGTAEWLADELVQARLLERAQAAQLTRVYRADEPFGDAATFAERLVRRGLLTTYQAQRALEGEARKLVLGAYVVTELIGPGSMGTVFRAVGRADRLSYAVKVLPLRNQWNVRMVRKQVQAFEHLPPHDSVVPFIDVGTAGKVHYLVWPFVEGRSVESLVSGNGPIRAPDIARLGIQLADALQHCHSRGLVHGVLKPTNVMIGYDGQARILDFGIGSLLADNSDDADGLVDTCSQAMTTAGMLECASPELVLDPAHLTGASDQYSLGCVLYFAATGSYPFPGGHAMDKLVAHQKQKPTPIWTLNREVPRALVAVIERLMHKAPEDRYRRVDELIHDLAPLAGSGLTMVPPPVPVDIRTPPPKLRLKPLSSRRSDVETPRSEAGDETHEMPLPPQPRRRGFLGRLFFGE